MKFYFINAEQPKQHKKQNPFLKFFEKIFKKIGGAFSKNKKKLDQEAERIDDFADDEFFDVDNGLSSLEIKDLGIAENRSDESLEENLTLREEVHHKSAAPGEESRQRSVRDIAFDDVEIDEEYTYMPPSDADAIIHGDSADAIFKGNFDPYNIAIAERMANKASTVSQDRGTYRETTVTETIDEIDERELERIRREAEFERAKARAEADAEREQLIREARRRAYAEAPYQSPDGGKSVAFNIREDEVVEEEPKETESISMTVEKSADSVYHEVTYDYREVESDEGSVSFRREAEEPVAPVYTTPSYEDDDEEEDV